MRFLGLDYIEEDIIRTAVGFASFSNLKNLEREDYFQSGKIGPADSRDNKSCEIRKGIIGGYKSYLSEADLEYIDELIRKSGCPFLNYN